MGDDVSSAVEDVMIEKLMGRVKSLRRGGYV